MHITKQTPTATWFNTGLVIGRNDLMNYLVTHRYLPLTDAHNIVTDLMSSQSDMLVIGKKLECDENWNLN